MECSHASSRGKEMPQLWRKMRCDLTTKTIIATAIHTPLLTANQEIAGSIPASLTKSIQGGKLQLEEKALQERLSDTNKQATSKRICRYKAIIKESKELNHARTKCNHKAKVGMQNKQRIYDYQVKCVIYVRTEVCSYKNPAVIPPFQSRVALTKTLQNRQNLAGSLAPRHTMLKKQSQPYQVI